jgi:hypothetical protein
VAGGSHPSHRWPVVRRREATPGSDSQPSTGESRAPRDRSSVHGAIAPMAEPDACNVWDGSSSLSGSTATFPGNAANASQEGGRTNRASLRPAPMRWRPTLRVDSRTVILPRSPANDPPKGGESRGMGAPPVQEMLIRGVSQAFMLRVDGRDLPSRSLLATARSLIRSFSQGSSRWVEGRG